MTGPITVRSADASALQPAGSDSHSEEGEIRKVGLGFAYDEFYWDGPLITVGATLCTISLNMTAIGVQLDPELSQTASMALGLAVGVVDAVLLTTLTLVSRKENRRRAALAKASGRSLLPKQGVMHYLRSKVKAPAQGVDAMALDLPALSRLRTIGTDGNDLPADLLQFFAALDVWRDISEVVSTARRARTIIALENLDRCLADFSVAPKSERDDDFLRDLIQTAEALTRRMNRDIEKVSSEKSADLSAEMRAIAKSANMDS